MSACRCGHALIDHEPFDMCTAPIGVGSPGTPRFLCGCDHYRPRDYQTLADIRRAAAEVRRPSLLERIRRWLRMG